MPLRCREKRPAIFPLAQEVSAAGGHDAGVAGVPGVPAPSGRPEIPGPSLSAAPILERGGAAVRRPGRSRASQGGGQP